MGSARAWRDGETDISAIIRVCAVRSVDAVSNHCRAELGCDVPSRQWLRIMHHHRLAGASLAQDWLWTGPLDPMPQTRRRTANYGMPMPYPTISLCQLHLPEIPSGAPHAPYFPVWLHGRGHQVAFPVAFQVPSRPWSLHPTPPTSRRDVDNPSLSPSAFVLVHSLHQLNL